MKPSFRKTLLLFAIFTAGGMLFASMFNPDPASGANSTLKDAFSLELQPRVDDKLKPVDNMHHFMEYIYQPVINQLKPAMEKEPADKAGWAKIKSASLIIAETSILLHDRPKEKEDAKTWEESSKEVYKGASALYQSARKKDFAGVKTNFKIMVDGCANCHAEYQ